MGQNTHLKGKIFVFLYVFKIIFSGHKIVVALPPNAPRGYGPGGRGYLSPKFSPWLKPLFTPLLKGVIIRMNACAKQLNQLYGH